MTQATQKTIETTARLYEIRTTARRLLGNNYKARMAYLGTVLEKLSTAHNGSVLDAATALIKRQSLDGVEVLLVLSAAVELIEPSPDQQDCAARPQ